MAGKFSLLTSLTLNAAGFNSGLDKAKQKTQDFAKGVEGATKNIKGQFGGLKTEIVQNFTGGLNPAIEGTMSSLKGLVGGVNSLRTALIASGVGAIVVALGTAFYSLNSYMTATKEGAERSKEAFAVIKGYAIETQNRINLLGRSLFNLFAGDLSGFAKDFKSVFNSDFLSNVIMKGAEAKILAEEQNTLKNEKLKLDKEELDVLLQQSELTKKAKDVTKESNFSAAQRLKFEQEAVRIGDEFDAKKLDFLQRQYGWIKKTNSMKEMVSDADLQAELEAYKTLTEYRIKDNQDAISENKIIAKTQKEIDSDALEAAKQRIALEKMVQTERLRTISINPDSMNFKNRGLDKLNKPAKIGIDKKGLEDLEKYQASIYQSATHQEYLFDNLTDSAGKLNNLKNVMISVGTSGSDLNNTFNVIGETIGNLGEIFGQQTLAYKAFAIAQAGINTFLGASQVLADKTVPTFLKPFLVGSMIALGLAQVSKIAGYATGGIVPGTSFSGDKVLARVNSGEMILNQSQQRNLFDMISTSNSGFGGEVRFEIDGQKLVGVLNNYNKKVRNTR